MLGYQGGPYYHVVDKLALPDALLARLPIAGEKTWQIGHFRRKYRMAIWKLCRVGRTRLPTPTWQPITTG